MNANEQMLEAELMSSSPERVFEILEKRQESNKIPLSYFRQLNSRHGVQVMDTKRDGRQQGERRISP